MVSAASFLAAATVLSQSACQPCAEAVPAASARQSAVSAAQRLSAAIISFLPVLFFADRRPAALHARDLLLDRGIEPVDVLTLQCLAQDAWIGIGRNLLAQHDEIAEIVLGGAADHTRRIAALLHRADGIEHLPSGAHQSEVA